ncbi:hypothetical protein QE152_g27397 [Popillia japonica]|uniref:Uncharacterized protein n=1 Tax=Popillia japonica TaxID=7064 RepID=A0AAW1JWE3_POPJA
MCQQNVLIVGETTQHRALSVGYILTNWENYVRARKKLVVYESPYKVLKIHDIDTPAPPPPVNAWTAKKQFPPLPVKKSQPSMSQQKRSSKEEVRSRNQEPEAGNCSSEESSSEEDSTPSAAVRRREPSSSGRVGTGLRSRSEQGDKLYLHEIANTMEEINSIVNLKKLSANLKQLLIAIKKCSTPFEQAMAIHQFNLDNAN